MKAVYFGENFDKAYDYVLNSLREQGKKEPAGVWQGTEEFKDMEMLVLRNLILTLEVDICTSCLVSTGADIEWAEEHFRERISGEPMNPGKSYKKWPYNNFNQRTFMEDNNFSHTYMERFWPKNAGNSLFPPMGIRFDLGDLNTLIELLQENINTRQAYLPIWFPEDLTAAKGKHRVPCTLGYYFYYEDGKLNCNYTIRSCDVYRHLRNDIYLTARLLQYVANSVNVLPGKLNFICYNFHLFLNDTYLLNKRETRLKIENRR